MTSKAGGRVFSGVKNKFSRAAAGDMQTARAVTGFAPGLSDPGIGFEMDSSVRTRGKRATDFRVALSAGFIADERCSGNFRWGLYGAGDRRTGDEKDGRGRDGAKSREGNYWVAESQGVFSIQY